MTQNRCMWTLKTFKLMITKIILAALIFLAAMHRWYNCKDLKYTRFNSMSWKQLKLFLKYNHGIQLANKDNKRKNILILLYHLLKIERIIRWENKIKYKTKLLIY